MSRIRHASGIGIRHMDSSVRPPHEGKRYGF